MNIKSRNVRALALWVFVVVTYFVVDRVWTPSVAGPVVASTDSIQNAQNRLARLRRLASTVPGKEEALKRVSAELAAREKAVIQAETAPLAQAQVREILGRVAKSLPQPIDFSSTELGQQVQPLGEHYGEVIVTVTFSSKVEDLVNLLAEISNQPELIATREMRIGQRGDKQKTLSVRLTVSGVVPRRLVPEKRGIL